MVEYSLKLDLFLSAYSITLASTNMSDSQLSNLIDEKANLHKERENTSHSDNTKHSPIHVTFSPQRKRQCSVVPKAFSALQLRRSISNTVERKPAEHIDLHQACKDGMIEIVKVLISDGTRDLDALDCLGYCPLHYAAKHDHDGVAKLLLDSGADPNLHNKCRRTMTPLQMACWFNSFETAYVLLKNGADVAAGARYGQLAIHCAAARGGTRIMEELLVGGKANPNYKDNSGFTPLHIAANNGRSDIVNVLLRHGADITLQDNDFNTPAHIAASEGQENTLDTLLQSAKTSGISMKDVLECTGNGSCLQLAVRKSHVEATKVCLRYGASTHGTEHDSSPPLHTACIHGNLELVKLLVWSGASVHAEDIEGMSPILRASLSGHLDIVNYLIDQGANLEAGPEEPTPLICAVNRGHTELIKLLLRRGSSINVRDSNHRTCVHVAVFSDNEETLDILLENGGRHLVNRRDRMDSTPLHFAAINHSLKMILKLLQYGADVTVNDTEEKLPLHYAADGDLSCFKALVNALHPTIHAQDNRLRTPLFYAALENNTQVMKFLIENGACVNQRDDDRLTPLLAISPSADAETIKLLLDNGSNIEDLSKNRNSTLNVAAFHGNTPAIKILLDREARINNDSPFGVGCLSAAISGGKEQACMEIVKHKRWKEILQIKGSDGFTCMKGLIEKFPEVAKVVMDKCIVTSNHATTDENYSITYNFEFLNVHPNERTKGNYIYFGPSSMIRNERRELLFHPLTRELLSYKWNSIAKYRELTSLSAYVAFVLILTIYMLCLGQLDLKTGKKIIVDKYPFCDKDSMEMLSLVLTVFSILWALGHVFKMFKERWKYFDKYAALEGSALISCLMATIVGLLLEDLEFRFASGIVCLLVCYFVLLFYLQTVLNSGIYVTMLFGVLKSFVKVIATFVVLLIVFALLFHLLLFDALKPKKVLKGKGEYANTTVEIKNPFQDIGMASVKVIAMMIGELEYTRFLVEQENHIPDLSRLVFFCFAIFLPIVLMNLLIGLAVGDIDAVQKDAELKLIDIKIESIYAVEQQLPTAWLRYLYKPFIVKYPNKKAKGFFQKLKAIGNRLVKTSNDYENILEDQEREDIENMEGLMNALSKRMDEQENRLDQLLNDIQIQRKTLDKLESVLLKENE